jgi:hypothetical protein
MPWSEISESDKDKGWLWSLSWRRVHLTHGHFQFGRAISSHAIVGSVFALIEPSSIKSELLENDDNVGGFFQQSMVITRFAFSHSFQMRLRSVLCAGKLDFLLELLWLSSYLTIYPFEFCVQKNQPRAKVRSISYLFVLEVAYRFCFSIEK